MNNELIQLLTERIALLRSGKNAGIAREKMDVADMDSTDEPAEERKETNSYVETIVVDFDFDDENQSDFHRFMNMRYFWVDWNDVITDVY